MNTRVSALELDAQIHGVSRDVFGNMKLDFRYRPRRHPCLGVVHSRERRNEALHKWLEPPPASFVVFRREPLQSHQKSDYSLLADLARPSYPVMRRAIQPVLVNQRRWGRPLFPVNVKIQMLKDRRHNQVPLAGQDSRTLWPADRLASAECHQVGPLRKEVPEIADWRQLAGGIHDHRDTGVVRHLDDLGQRRLRPAARDVAHCRCL